MADRDPDRTDRSVAAETSPRRRFLTFFVNERRYALPAETIAEVIPAPPVARLPRSPKCLLGLANLRGTVIPVIDMRILLGRKPADREQGPRAIVLAGAAPVALAVDATDVLVTIDVDEVETRQMDPATDPGEILQGAFQLDRVGEQRTGGEQNVARILDLPAMLKAAFESRSEPRREVRSSVTAGQEMTEPANSVERRSLVSFDVAGQTYGLPLDTVREIIAVPETMTVVPHAETVLLGVTAWRETLLPLLSLRGLLGFPQAANWDGREKVFVVAVNGSSVGLVADRARALVRADVRAIDAAPAMLAARTGGESKIAAIFRANGGQNLISILAPERLFREDVMQRIGESSSHSLPGPTTAATGAFHYFVVFRLGDEAFGLPVAAVEEVARVPTQITRVPKMPDFVEGVVNLRGAVLAVVDQRRRFDMPKFAGGAAQRLIVVRAERHRAGLIVDQVAEVFRAEAAAIEPPPDLTGESARLVNGVINDRLAGRMILLLDPAELLTPSEQSALDELGPGDDGEPAHRL